MAFACCPRRRLCSSPPFLSGRVGTLMACRTWVVGSRVPGRRIWTQGLSESSSRDPFAVQSTGLTNVETLTALGISPVRRMKGLLFPMPRVCWHPHPGTPSGREAALCPRVSAHLVPWLPGMRLGPPHTPQSSRGPLARGSLTCPQRVAPP